MLDRIRAFIPFKPHCVVGGEAFLTAHDGMQMGHSGPLWDIKALGLPDDAMRPRRIERDGEGRLLAKDLFHPWETLPTSFTGLAMKVYHEGNQWPGVELKCSPAKILQGHNVFGPTSIRLGWQEMLSQLASEYPELMQHLEVKSAQLLEMDCTFSARLPDETVAHQVIEHLSNVSNGHTKARGDVYKTTAYWGAKASRLKKLKAYLKWDEFKAQLAEYRKAAKHGDLTAARVAKVMSDERLGKWCQHLLRFEATVKKRWLERRGIPTNIYFLMKYQEQLEASGRCLIRECWQDTTRDIFRAFEGRQMRVVDDKSVMDALKAVHFRITPKGNISYGKANKLFLFYNGIRDYGFAGMQERIPKETFRRHLKDLEVAGFTKAFLQNLCEDTRANNVFPLLRFVEVDFSAQRPDWYREPGLSFERAA